MNDECQVLLTLFPAIALAARSGGVAGDWVSASPSLAQAPIPAPALASASAPAGNSHLTRQPVTATSAPTCTVTFDRAAFNHLNALRQSVGLGLHTATASHANYKRHSRIGTGHTETGDMAGYTGRSSSERILATCYSSLYSATWEDINFGGDRTITGSTSSPLSPWCRRTRSRPLRPTQCNSSARWIVSRSARRGASVLLIRNQAAFLP